MRSTVLALQPLAGRTLCPGGMENGSKPTSIYHVEIDRIITAFLPNGWANNLKPANTATAIELFQGGNASPPSAGATSRLPPHYDSRAHAQEPQAHLEWTPSRLIHWGETIGPATAEVIPLSSPAGRIRKWLSRLPRNLAVGQDLLE